jgi:3,4-dihydroxy 2-butanone 4-phosphate synthase/GTP cyclohydrolase II
MTGERLDALRIGSMVHGSDGQTNGTGKDTAFSVSVDVRRGTTTGISALDRALTVKALIDEATRPEDFVRPGHVFPLRAKEGGVLVRAGHTEAAVDLARMAGLKPAGVICEILDDDGAMARLPRLQEFAARHRLRIVSIADLIEHRRRTEKFVRRLVTTKLPTPHGEFALHLYEDALSGSQHLALVRGEVAGRADVLVRVHSSCITGDTLLSLRCDCGQQLAGALARIGEEGQGVLLYLNQEGRGIGLLNKMRCYALQDQGLDTVQANEALGLKPDLRDYGIGAQILSDLGLTTLRLLTNNPRKIIGLEGHRLAVTGRVPIEVRPNGHNERYIRTKKEKLGHIIGGLEAAV